MEDNSKTFDNENAGQKNEMFEVQLMNRKEPSKEQMEKWQEEKSWFMLLGPASLIYALVFVICEYRNYASIMTSVWIASTCIYACYVMKKLNIGLKKDSIAMLVAMLLLGISSVMTGNGIIHFLNMFGFFLLLIFFLLYNFYEEQKWGYGKVCAEILVALFGAIATIPLPFEESMAYFRLRKRRRGTKSYGIMIGLLLALPFVLVAGLCLGLADAVFANIIDNMFSLTRIQSFEEDLVFIPMMLLFGFLSSYCGMRYMTRNVRLAECEKQRKQYSATIAISFLSPFAIMYLVFSGIQIIYLFLGFGTLPNDITYASYARTGFFQLLFVAIMNLFIVLCMKKRFEEHRMLNAMLYLVCLCTLIMAASSVYRMVLYIMCYHLTFSRVFALVTLAVITSLVIGIMIYLHNSEFHLFRFGLYVITIGYLVFSLSHVDYWIARYNIKHICTENQEEILDYMNNLSSDAAPVIMTYIEENNLKTQIRKDCARIQAEEESETYFSRNWYRDYYNSLCYDFKRKGLRKWNYSIWKASNRLFNPIKK